MRQNYINFMTTREQACYQDEWHYTHNKFLTIHLSENKDLENTTEDAASRLLPWG